MPGHAVSRGIAGASIVLVAACRFTGLGDPDATSATDDSRRADAPVDAVDAEPTFDGMPDAAPDAAPVTVTFGEAPGTTFMGVTSDTWIESLNMNLNHVNDPGIWADAGPVTNGLLHFDVAAIPVGSQILTAQLQLVTTTDLLETGTVQIYPVIERWVAGVATWIERTMPSSWANAGASPPGSRGTTLVAEFVPNTTLTAYTVSLDLPTVQAWVDSPTTNFGLVLISTSPASNGVTFSSSEEPVTTSRPVLTITYQP